MEKLAKDEAVILNHFEAFVNEIKIESGYITSKLKNWKNICEKIEKDPMKHIHNPLDAYLMIKRSSADIDLILKRMYDIINGFKANIQEIKPTNHDLVGTIDGILRLQSIYHLKTSDLINGIIDGEKTSDKLRPHDIFTIASEASHFENRAYFTDEYLNYTRNSFEKGEDVFNEVSEDEIQKVIQANENYTRIDPFNERLERKKSYCKTNENIYYSKACRQMITKTPKEAKDLKCLYVSNSAFSKIAPFKVMEADHHSNLVVFIDIISDNEIEILKNLSQSKLQRGETISSQNVPLISNKRVVQTSWFEDKKHEVFARLSRRMEDMTGLSISTAEALIVQNYGVAGHYKLHWDHSVEDEEPFELGNRIATLLLCLTTVEKGGATIFPYLKVYNPAIKGTAAFWYNLRDNGYSDYHTRHASCPVIIGTKWVSNKWFHEYNQEFRRPCKPGKSFKTRESDLYEEFF